MEQESIDKLIYMDQQMKQKQIQNHQSKQQIQNITILRLPFHVKTQQKLKKLITKQILQKIQQKQDFTLSLIKKPLTKKKNLQQTQQQQNLSSNNLTKFKVNIFKKKLIRPVKKIKVKKMKHKKTGKIIKLVTEQQEIDTLYEYEELGDFVNTMGTDILYGEKMYSINQQDIWKLITKKLTEKVLSNQQSIIAENDEDNFLKLIQPISFLREYNFVPPSCDMLLNKIKKNPTQSTFVGSKSISFEDPIPLSQGQQIPKFILQTELFRKLTQYFQKRPCWLKNSLYYALNQDDMKDKFTTNDFKNVMKYTAYTYRNGPWKHTFCKFGFDPKKQFKSIIYQTMSIKLKQKQVQDYGNQKQQNVYDPTFQQISSRCIRSYQLCDISNDTIKEIVQGKLITKEGECTKETGWLNGNQHSRIMKIMKSRILENQER